MKAKQTSILNRVTPAKKNGRYDASTLTVNRHVPLPPLVPGSLVAQAIYRVWLSSIDSERKRAKMLEFDDLTAPELADVVIHLHRRAGARILLHGNSADRMKLVFGDTLYPFSDLVSVIDSVQWGDNPMTFSSPRGALTWPTGGDRNAPRVELIYMGERTPTSIFTARNLPLDIPFDVLLAGVDSE